MIFSQGKGCNFVQDRYNGAVRHMTSRVVVAPSVPPQRLPVNLVRSGRKQPQREHCVPGCGWWGCLHLRRSSSLNRSLSGGPQVGRQLQFPYRIQRNSCSVLVCQRVDPIPKLSLFVVFAGLFAGKSGRRAVAPTGTALKSGLRWPVGACLVPRAHDIRWPS